MASDHVTYRERTPWAAWVYALLWGVVLLSLWPILAGVDMSLPFERRFVIAGGVLALTWVVQVLFSGTTVLVETEAIRVHLGQVPLVSKRIPYAEIRSLESVSYHPLKEFGGWGLRFRGDKQAWTARGDQAVVLHRTSGPDLYIGSDHPHRLEDRIRMAAGGHLASSAPRS